MALVKTVGYTTTHTRPRMGELQSYDLILNTDHIGHIQPATLQAAEAEMDCLLVHMVYETDFYVDVTFLEKGRDQ